MSSIYTVMSTESADPVHSAHTVPFTTHTSTHARKHTRYHHSFSHHIADSGDYDDDDVSGATRRGITSTGGLGLVTQVTGQVTLGDRCNPWSEDHLGGH